MIWVALKLPLRRANQTAIKSARMSQMCQKPTLERARRLSGLVAQADILRRY